jgi:hypothetical protein
VNPQFRHLLVVELVNIFSISFLLFKHVGQVSFNNLSLVFALILELAPFVSEFLWNHVQYGFIIHINRIRLGLLLHERKEISEYASEGLDSAPKLIFEVLIVV